MEDWLSGTYGDKFYGYQPKAGQDQEKSGGKLRYLFAFMSREQIPLQKAGTSIEKV
jgi:hypothetical protein